VLFAYPITAFVVGADWGRVVRDTLVPSMPHARDEWSTRVALGITISPYLFFWQASEEVEGLKKKKRPVSVRSLNGEEQRSKNSPPHDQFLGNFFRCQNKIHAS